MAEAASISYGNEFSSEPRKSPLDKHIPESSKVRKTHPPWRGLVQLLEDFDITPVCGPVLRNVLVAAKYTSF